jgi:hypothetical protein
MMSDKYNSKIAAFVGWLNKSPYGYAVTISSTCTLYSTPAAAVGDAWRKHEDCHKGQIAKLGWFTFMYRYFKYNLSVGYVANPFETEAREAGKL